MTLTHATDSKLAGTQLLKGLPSHWNSPVALVLQAFSRAVAFPGLLKAETLVTFLAAVTKEKKEQIKGRGV